MYADVSDGELVRGLHNKFYSDIPYEDFLKKIDFRQEVNPTEGMSGLDKARAGAGKAFVDISRGVRQITGNADQAEIDEAKRMDAPLMKTGAGVAGNIGAGMAMFLPTMAIPGANTVTGAALIGGAANAIQPVATGESRLWNTGVGAASGAAGQILGNAVGRLAQPVTSRLSPEEQALAAAAARNKIPLSPGQATGSKPLQITETVLENLPFTSGAQIAQKQGQASAFNRAVLAKAGIDADSATAATLAAQKQALGQTFEDIAGRNAIDFNAKVGGQTVVDKLSDIAGTASRRLTPDKAKVVQATVDDILSQVDSKGLMAGTNYQGWRSELRTLGQGTDYEAQVFTKIKKALDEAFSAGVSGADATAWKKASREYANLKTILDAMGGAGAETKIGNIPPAQLERALTNAMGREGKALGRGDLNELVGIGRRFVSEKIPDSASAQRALYQSLITGGVGSGLGAGTAYATGHDPVEGALLGAGATGVGLALPKLVQVLTQSPAARAYIARQAGSPTAEAIRNALQVGGRGVGIAAPVSMGFAPPAALQAPQ